MNDAGLAVSLTFGGRFVHGPGFAILIVLRYLLETCTTVDEAIGKLKSLPIAIPQNVTLVDSQKGVTVFVGPDISLIEAPDACAANHQHMPVPDEQEQFSRTQERLSAIRAAGTDVAVMASGSRRARCVDSHVSCPGSLPELFVIGNGRILWPPFLVLPGGREEARDRR